MKSVLLIIGIVSVVACNKHVGKSIKNSDPLPEGTIELKLHESLKGKNLSLRFDSVISDSRCPANVVCVWQGEASVKFTIIKNGTRDFFNLSTINMEPSFRKDTVIYGYKIELLNIYPYPGTYTPPVADSEVKAELKITKV